MTDWPALWSARWIWGERPPSAGFIQPLAAPPPAAWNRFFCFRRAFTLETLPESVPARVTADSRFVLYVNGQEVSRGPARSSPERLSYRTLELSSHLHADENVIAAMVRFYGRAIAWWRPAPPDGQLGYGSFIFESPAIGIISDSAWRTLPAPYAAGGGGTGTGIEHFNPPAEIVDGTSLPPGWNAPGFDDGGWSDAIELRGGGTSADRYRVPASPYTAMEPDGIAPLTMLPLRLTRVATLSVPASSADDPIAALHSGDGGAETDPGTVYDAGRITLATPWVEVEGEAGAAVDLYAGEDRREDGMVEVGPRDYALRYRLAGTGTERIEGFDAVGFRFLGAVTRGSVRVLRAGATERRYPRGSEAAFECSDERLNEIWRTGARTLDVCASDAFIDCPGREQRAWLGDAYVHALLTYTTNADWRLARRHLEICAQAQRADGLLAMSAAGDLSTIATTIPDYSLHWLRTIARYVEYSNDIATARTLLPAAMEIAGFFERYRAADGLLRGVPGWVFIDWAMVQRAEVTGALDALYAGALDDLAWLLETADGNHAAAERMRALRDRTRSAFAQLWDGERGVYVDAAGASGPLRRISQHTNAMAIIGGCAPRERWDAMLDYILDERRVRITPTMGDLPDHSAFALQQADPAEYIDFDEREHVVGAQPFFAHFLHQAVVLAGRRALMPSLCLRWWPQVQRGYGTFEEFWSARPGAASRAHAWSATPTYDLTAHVLGVQPLTPGYQRAAIRPLFGALTRLSGRVPTPQGLIELDLTRQGGSIVVPEGVTAEVAFEDVALSGGVLGAGRHEVR